MNIVKYCIAAISICICYSSACWSQAQLITNGVAQYSDLKTDYYIGALELASKSSDASEILANTGSQKLTLRIKEEWSPRRFKRLWQDAILLNNDQQLLISENQNIELFLSLPKAYLLPGDELIASYADGKTNLSINGSNAFSADGKTLFNILLSTWIGSKPPSTKFKDEILGLKDSDKIKTEYNATNTDPERAFVTANWFRKSAPAQPIKLAEPVAVKPVKSIVKLAAKPLRNAVNPAPKQDVASSTAKISNAPAINEQAQLASLEKAKQIELLQQYQALVQTAILDKARYPRRNELAKEVDGLVSQMAPEGIVSFNLQMNRQGKILDIQETVVSDIEILNKFALKAVKKATIPLAPETLKGSIFQAPITLNFARSRVQ